MDIGGAPKSALSPEAELLEELADPAFKANPYPTFDLIRREPGWRSPSGFRVFARYRDVHEILRQPAIFGQITRPQPSFHVMDPPDHTRLRGLVNRAFTPRSISAQDEMIREVASELVLQLKDAGRMEFMSEYARPFPAMVISRILGVPYEGGERWNTWLDAVRASRGVIHLLEFDPEEVEDEAVTARSEGRKIADYLRGLMEERRSSLGDDIISRLITARDGDDVLSEDEVLFTLVLLLGAGLHTTTGQLGNLVFTLLQRPEVIAQIRSDPDLIPNAVEEGMRFDGAVQSDYRLVHQDTTVGGVELTAGERVMLLFGAANRDPDVFDEPDVFDIYRENASAHLTFGFGIHRCLGAPLAKVELQTGLRSVLLGLPDLHMVGDPNFHRYDRFRALGSLDVAWSPAASSDSVPKAS
jgi:cytochrome P450